MGSGTSESEKDIPVLEGYDLRYTHNANKETMEKEGLVRFLHQRHDVRAIRDSETITTRKRCKCLNHDFVTFR